MTPAECVSLCEANGYAYAGVEYGSECYCGSSRPSTRVADTACNVPCSGSSAAVCGGAWALILYALGRAARAGNSAAATTTKATTTTTKATTTTTTTTIKTIKTTATAVEDTAVRSPTLVGSNAANNYAFGTTKNGPASGTKYLWARPHGRQRESPLRVYTHAQTWSYTSADWTTDINHAKSAGIDGFALNMGSDPWQPDRVATACSVAQSLGFKMFLSFEMTAVRCGSAADAGMLTDLVKTYASHPAQAKYNGRAHVSTFSGENCHFGQGSVQAGWLYLRSLVPALYFVPAHFSDVSTFAGATWFDGVFNWDASWPWDNNAITTASDDRYLAALGSKGYMTAVSPWFFTYYGPSSYNKNWIYRSDDWHITARMEQLVANRNKYDHAEIISWNDFGEST